MQWPVYKAGQIHDVCVCVRVCVCDINWNISLLYNWNQHIPIEKMFRTCNFSFFFYFDPPLIWANKLSTIFTNTCLYFQFPPFWAHHSCPSHWITYRVMLTKSCLKYSKLTPEKHTWSGAQKKYMDQNVPFRQTWGLRYSTRFHCIFVTLSLWMARVFMKSQQDHEAALRKNLLVDWRQLQKPLILRGALRWGWLWVTEACLSTWKTYIQY